LGSRTPLGRLDQNLRAPTAESASRSALDRQRQEEGKGDALFAPAGRVIVEGREALAVEGPAGVVARRQVEDAPAHRKERVSGPLLLAIERQVR